MKRFLISAVVLIASYCLGRSLGQDTAAPAQIVPAPVREVAPITVAPLGTAIDNFTGPTPGTTPTLAQPAAPAPGMPELTNVSAQIGPAAPPAPETESPTASAGAPTTAPATALVPTPPAPARNPLPSPAPGEGVRLNFQGAGLNDVLNYLSEAAGFVIVQEVPVSGTVNIVSRQTLTPEEAVDLLNVVLVEKGLLAIRNGRILKIVSRRDAGKRDLPVAAGSDPEKIPAKDDIVTQILPLRSGEATKLIENLRPLLSDTATITANEASNSIMMTDTQNNIRRVARIIKAIDESVSTISTIRVFPLTHADAKELAETITQLFSPTSTNSASSGSSRDRRSSFFPPFPGMPGSTPTQPQSEAKQAASRVVAVADEQSNSIIVAAPDEVMTTIKEIIVQVDTSVTDVTETQIFRLKHADAVELAQTLTSLYSDGGASPSSSSGGSSGSSRSSGGSSRSGRSSRSSGGSSSGRSSGGFPFPFGGMFGGSSGGGQSERALEQAKVVAVGDPRTNSLIVAASHESLAEIAAMVARLDEGEAKKQRVFVHSLKNADAENVATILRSMFNDTTSSTTRTDRLSERVSTGVESTAADSISNSSRTGR